MDTLKQIIQQCHNRKNRTPSQRKTTVLPAGYNEYPYHFRVHYAHEKSVILYDLEKAHISFMLIGQSPFDRAPSDWASKKRIENRQDTQNWRSQRWYASWGIGIYTGETSGQAGANWHDIEFTYQAVLNVPDAVSLCLEALIGSVVNPLVTLTKEGGLRFSCRVLDYVHPSTIEAKQYIYKHQPTQTDPKHRDVFVKVKGAMDYSVWDARYEVLTGSLLEPPVISGDVLFALLGFFRSALHRPGLGSVDRTLREYEPKAFDGDNAINPLEIDEREVSVPEKMRAVREGNLSPLAIKRPRPVLTKQAHSEPELFDIADILETDTRVIGIETGLRHPEENCEIERAADTQYTLIVPVDMDEVLEDTLKRGNTKSTHFRRYIPWSAKILRDAFEGSDVIWVFGTLYWSPDLIWKQAKILFGDEAEPLDYSVSMNPYIFNDNLSTWSLTVRKEVFTDLSSHSN